MKDNIKCQHTLSGDVIYKEVVVIGNGPSGMVTSFMLAGNVPHLKPVPEDLPIDDMLRARLSNLPVGVSLYETDLMELAEGLEGRSQNPIPLLMDTLLRPCADLGIEADPLIEWRYDAEKQIEHIVLGRGPPGGAWHTFPGGVRTLSPAGWLALPPHAGHGAERLPARAVALYCRRYVTACKLQRYFCCGLVVTAVTRAPELGEPCAARACPRQARYCVSGYDKSSGAQFQYVCRRVVVCSGAQRANTLAPHIARHSLHSLDHLERATKLLGQLATPSKSPSVLIVGSGVSAADAAWLALRCGLHARHVHRAPAPALQALPRDIYPDYTQIYKMMCDGASGQHHNYTSYPSHVIVDVTPEPSDLNLNTEDIDEYKLNLKRVKLLDITTNQTTEVLVNLICVFIGSKPDLNFLQTNFSLNCIDVTENVTEKTCQKCLEENAKRKMEEKCFLKNHWSYLKTMVGQSLQSCKSKYLNLDEKFICDDNYKKCDMKAIPFKSECQCETDPYVNGIGFGVDPDKPVDSRNPVAVDKSTHEMLNAPKGMYALGPLTNDNFMRFIPGGALAAVAHMHKEI